MKKTIIESVRIILIAAVLSVGVGIAFAWTVPASPAPAGNVTTPLNVSSTGQAKQGNLIITGLDASSVPYTNGLLVLNGNVGIATTTPSEKLEVIGNIKATAFLYSSDLNLKKNIQPLGSELDKVMALQAVSYEWKANNSSDIGFIAQEVEKIFPEVVHTSETTNLKSIDYPKLTVYLVQALQEQQKEIEQLKLNK